MSILFGKSRKVPKRKRSGDLFALPVETGSLREYGTMKSEMSFSRANSPTGERLVTTNGLTITESLTSFARLGLAQPLVEICQQLGLKRPTPIQQQLIPFLLHNRREHVLALASTGTGKTAAFLLPILHHLSSDPCSVFGVVVTPTRELAQQIQQQCMALGAPYSVVSVLVVGGLDCVTQSCQLAELNPHLIVATPGRLAALLRGPPPRPRLRHCRYLVLDEADRLLAAQSGFEKDVAEILLHTKQQSNPQRNGEICQTLLLSATMTASLNAVEELAAGGQGCRLPLRRFIVQQASEKDAKRRGVEESNVASLKEDQNMLEVDDTGDNRTMVGPKIPNGLKQEYIFMPSKVRDAYLLATVRTLLANGGRTEEVNENSRRIPKGNKKQNRYQNLDKASGEALSIRKAIENGSETDVNDADEAFKAKSAIIFVSTCERAALVSGILEQVGVPNVALHSLLSQPRRLAALGKFQSEQVRILVATDVAARGLDIPATDLVINCELPRNPVTYVHRVGRTARAGRRGRAVSLVAESDVRLVHAAERASGRELTKCVDVTDEIAVKLLGPATKAARLVKLKLNDIGFGELVQKFKERKARDKEARQRLDSMLRKQEQHAVGT